MAAAVYRNISFHNVGDESYFPYKVTVRYESYLPQ